MLRGLFDAVAGAATADARRLHAVLEAHRDLFRAPLDNPPPSADHRREVQTGDVVVRGVRKQLSQEAIQYVLELSDRLPINEKMAAELVDMVLQDRVTTTSAHVVERAAELLKEERTYLLHALKALVQLPLTSSDPALCAMAVSFVNTLLAEPATTTAAAVGGPSQSLIMYLLGKLSLEGNNQPDPDEAFLIADCVFWLIYRVFPSSAEVEMLLKAILQCTKRTKRGDPRASHTTFVLTVTLVSLLTGAGERHASEQPADRHAGLLLDPTFVHAFHGSLCSTWDAAAAPVQSAVQLAWSLFLTIHEDLDAQERALMAGMQAVELGVFDNLSRMIESDLLVLIDGAEFFTGFLVRLVTCTLQHNQHLVREVKARDISTIRNRALASQAAAAAPPVDAYGHPWYGAAAGGLHDPHHDPHRAANGAAPPSAAANDKPTSYEHLLKLVSAAYANHPEIWDEVGPQQDRDADSVLQFLRDSADAFDMSLYHLFIDVLASLANSTTGADLIYHVILGHDAYWSLPRAFKMSWDFFFDRMNQLARSIAADHEGGASNLDMHPADVERLRSLFRLIGRVTSFSDRTAQILYARFHSPDLLFRFLCLPVGTVQMRAEIFSALGAFARHVEYAGEIWRRLSDSGILAEGGIRVQLESEESRAQVYPETLAFLALLEQLMDVIAVGSDEWAGTFGPFVEYVRDSVFGHFHARSYARPGDKWIVAARALRILLKVLKERDTAVGMYRLVGDELLQNFLSESQFYKRLVSILCTGVRAVATERLQSESGKDLQEAVELALEFVELVLVLQDPIVDNRHANNLTFSLHPLEDILTGFEGAKKNALLEIASYVQYPHSAQIRLRSTNIIYLLSQSQRVRQELVQVFRQSATDLDLRSAYVQLLELAPYLPPQADQDPAHYETKLVILKVLLGTIGTPMPNLAQYLIGFTFPNVEETNFSKMQERTCLHVLERMLSLPDLSTEAPDLCELAMELIHRLCADKRMSNPVLRYLRSQDPERDYFFSQMLRFSFPTVESVTMVRLRQLSWLEQTAALEIHRNVAPNKLMSLLFSATGEDGYSGALVVGDDESPRPMKLLELLDAIDAFQVTKPSPPEPQERFRAVFDREQFKLCLRAREGGGMALYHTVDLRLLMQQQLDAYRSAERYGAQPGFMAEASQEMERILHKAVAWNQYLDARYAKVSAFYGWRQIVEVVLSTPRKMEILATDCDMDQVLFALLDALMKRVATPGGMPTEVSRVMLFVMTKVRERQLLKETRMGFWLDKTQLQTMLKGIVDSIVMSGTRPQMRENLYCVLLNYLRFTHGRGARSAAADVANAPMRFDPATLALDESQDMQLRAIQDVNYNTLRLSGDKLIDVVARDAAMGAPRTKTAAFAMLGGLIQYDRQHRWLEYLVQRGYLQHFLQELQHQNDALLEVLVPEPLTNAINLLFVYEAKMSFLDSLARTAEGAKALFHQGAIVVLAQVQFFDRPPDHLLRETTALDSGSVLPSVMDRYGQLLNPVLQLITSLACSLPRNKEVASGVCDFFLAHHTLLTSAVLKKRERGAATQEQHKCVASLLFMLRGFDDLYADKMWQHGMVYQELLMTLFVAYVEEEPKELVCWEVCLAILSYCLRAGELVFSPVMQSDRSFARLVPIATLIKFLYQCAAQHKTSVQQQQQLRSKQQHVEDLSDLEVTKWALEHDEVSRGTSRGQQRAALLDSLQKLEAVRQKEAVTVMALVEMALVLLWQHLAQWVAYSRGSAPAPAPDGFRLTIAELETLQREISSQLDGLSVDSSEVVDKLVRRVKESLRK